MSGAVKAGAALESAARMERAARAHSGWYATYLWVFAGWQLIFVPTLFLWRGPVGALVCGGANAALVTALSVHAARQRTVPRGHTRRHLGVIGAWTVAYTGSVVLAFTVLEPGPPFVAMAAVACALPPAWGAWRTRRPA